MVCDGRLILIYQITRGSRAGTASCSGQTEDVYPKTQLHHPGLLSSGWVLTNRVTNSE